MHSLVQALTLTLTLTLNHLANKPQRTASTLFGLMYLSRGSTTEYFNKCARARDESEFSRIFRANAEKSLAQTS